MSTYRSSGPIRVGFALVLLVVVVVVWALWSAATAGKPERFIFLYFRETNNNLLKEAPVGPLRGPFVQWMPAEPKLVLPETHDLPPTNTRLAVLHDIEHYDVTVRTRLYYSAELPALLDTAAPVGWQEGVRDLHGEPVDRIAVVNDGRSPPEKVSIQELRPDGTAVLRVGDQAVALTPGEGWGVARGRTETGLKAVPSGPHWDEFVTAQLTNRRPLTVFTVYNYGWLAGEAVTLAQPGGEGP
jgi:hypothetical protein